MRTALASVCLSLALVAGCSPAATSPAGAAYESQQAACLALQTHAERIACIKQVRTDWASDGGAE